MARDYGAEAYNRDAMYARVMLENIHIELADVAFFTREDLMHLPCFQHVATITRYNYVCRAVRHCIEKKWILPISNTGLILSGKKRDFLAAHTQWEEFLPTVSALVPVRGTTFDLMYVLRRWDTDEHLTYNTKRVICRHVLKRLKTTEVIKEVNFNQYERV